MKRILIMLALLISASPDTYAQNDADVRRYTANYFSGTARFQAMGGAFGALGGDMSSVHINPAGVSVFRFGEISFTPAYEFNDVTAQTDFTSRLASKSKLVVNNVGFVLANEVNHPKWQSINFSVSYNRINTFNDLVQLTGQSAAIDGLAGDFLVRAREGGSLDQLNDFGNGLAWDTFVIDSENYNDEGEAIDDGNYVLGFAPEEEIQTNQTVERDGRLSETALTLGANYNNELYFGFGLGFQDVFYQSVAETRESTVGDAERDLLSYTFTERLESEGLGVNARLGVIYRKNNIRLGASVRTPTVFAMTDNFSSDMLSRLRDDDGTISNREAEADGFFEYRIRTPWHFMASVAGVIGKNAIITAQYERVDFGGGELRNADSGADADFSAVNRDINQFYSASDIIRLGAEYRLGKSFAIRGGYAFFANPIDINEESTDESLDRQEFNFGIGYRKAAWHVDLSYSKILFNQVYPYTDLNDALLENDQNIVSLTIGIRM